MRLDATMMDSTTRARAPARALLLALGGLALAAGLYARLRGLGTWPLGVDEFYISRSIDHILKSGLPAFPCGGYYTRGLLYQYGVALLRLAGVGPELAGRSLAVLASIVVLPLGYGLGRRLGGVRAGWLMVIVLSLSIWEIEMARFGRMYAPYQAVFLGYTLAYLRFVTAQSPGALALMVLLSIVGTLTWEGGALLGAASVLAVILSEPPARLSGRSWRRIGSLLVLLALLFLMTRDLRGYAQLPDAGPEAPEHARLLGLWIAPLKHHPWRSLVFVVPLLLGLYSVPFILEQRRRPLNAIALACALIAAALHCFIISGGLLALLLVAGWLAPRELASPAGRRYLMSLGAFLVLWLAFGLASPGPARVVLLHTGEELLGFPNVFGAMVRPWGRTMPLLVVALAAALSYWLVQVIRAPRTETQTPTPMAALLALFIVMVLAVGMIPTERIETRYSFFLYPLAIAFGISAVLDWSRRHPGARASWAALLVPLAVFAATEDFQPRHMAAIDSARVNFRIGMSAARSAHYYPRSDVRSTGEWLRAHVTTADRVVTGIPTLAQYGPPLDYFFFERGDDRYESYVCADGHTDRWTDDPVLYGEESLAALVRAGRPVYLTVYPEVEARLKAASADRGWSLTRVFTSGNDASHVLLLTPAAAGADRAGAP
ncbi:MAG TPA: hypothetical protein VKT22_05195 [Steroidobacteraceae bacterium]|nr:hypothetical protein [Steroidobacteraceae bacterium]